MKLSHLSRRRVLAIGASGAVGAAVAIGALAPWQSRNAEAQVDPVQTSTDAMPEQYDPALAETDSALSASEPANATSDPVLTAPATPVVTPEAVASGPTWEPTESGMSTSLGGSDIAVASEGGSYEIDGPKRKANKILGENKRP